MEPGGLFTNSAIPGVAVTNTNSPGKGWVVRATSVFSPTWSNEAGYAWSAGGIFSTPAGSINAARSPDIHPTLPFPSTTGRVPGIAFSGAVFDAIQGFGPYTDSSANHNIFDNMTKVMGHARLLTWNGEGHTSYLQGSACIDRYVNNYLISGALPPPHTVCPR